MVKPLLLFQLVIQSNNTANVYLLFDLLVFVGADVDSMQSPYGSSVFEKASRRSAFCLYMFNNNNNTTIY